MFKEVEEYLKETRNYMQNNNLIQNSIYYAGVGHRLAKLNTNEIPTIKQQVQSVAYHLKQRGFILRSGGASGLDTFFEENTQGQQEIYLKRDFRHISQSEYELLAKIAAYFHPLKQKLLDKPSYIYKPLMRNYFQVMGANIHHVKPIAFGILFTHDGAETHEQRSYITGGTGQFISYADYFGIPCFNMKNYPDILTKIKEKLYE